MEALAQTLQRVCRRPHKNVRQAQHPLTPTLMHRFSSNIRLLRSGSPCGSYARGCSQWLPIHCRALLLAMLNKPYILVPSLIFSSPCLVATMLHNHCKQEILFFRVGTGRYRKSLKRATARHPCPYRNLPLLVACEPIKSVLCLERSGLSPCLRPCTTFTPPSSLGIFRNDRVF